MLSNYSGTTVNVMLALERHRSLIEEAQRRREHMLARQLWQERPMRWRRIRQQLRNRVGDLLVTCGERIKTGTAGSAVG